MEVETLLPQLQDTLAQIKSTFSELSSTAQNDELDRLEQHRDQLLADLQASFQKEKEELEAKREKELEDIKKKRQQEDEERAARRRREDEELKKATSTEDNNRQQKYDNEVGSIEDETERKMDEVEQTAEKKIEEGKKKLHDLDEKRKELNRRIDDQLTQSLPASPPRRKRSKDRSKKEAGELSRDSSKVQENGLPEDKSRKHEDGVPKDKPNDQENGLPKDSSMKRDDNLPIDNSKKQDDKLQDDKSTSQQDEALTDEKSKNQDNDFQKDKSIKQEDKLPEDKSMSPEEGIQDGQKSEKSEKSKKQENELAKDKSTKQVDGFSQDESKKQKNGPSKDKPTDQGDERPKEGSKQQENESPKNKSKKHEDELSQDTSGKQQNGHPKDQAGSREEEQPKEKSKKQEGDSSKKSKKREDERQKDSTNGVPTSDGQQNDDLSPKPKKDSSPKSKKSDSRSATPSKSRPPVPSSPERSSESKKDGELPSQVDRTISSPQAAKNPAKNEPRSFADALKSNMSNGLKDNPEHGESNASHVAQKQDIPGDLASIVPTIQPATESRRCEDTESEMNDNTRGWRITEKPNSLPDKKSIPCKSEEKSDKEVSRRCPPSSKSAESNDGLSNTYYIPKSAEQPKLQEEQTPEKITSGSQSVSTENSNVPVPNVEDSTKREENQRPIGQPHTPARHKTDSKQSSRTAGGGASPKTPERSPIKNRAASESAKTDCQSVDPRSTIQPQRLSTAPDKRKSGQENRPHNQMEFRQPAVSYFPEQTQPSDGSSANVLKQPETSERPSQSQSESPFLTPPSPIQADLVLSLDKDQLDISPKSGTPMGFEHIQNSNSEFLHVIGQQGQGKVTSPLPVENETVRGEDQLFDENKSVSDLSEHGMGEEETELLPHIPIDEGGQLVLLESPFQPRFDDQGLTSLIGALQRWAILIKEINEQSDASICRPLLLEFPHVQEDDHLTVPDTQTITGSNKLRDNYQEPRPPSSELSILSDKPTIPAHDIAHEAEPSLSRSSSLSQNTNSHSPSTPIASLCNNLLTGLVGPSSESSEIVPHTAASVHSNASKRKLRSSSTESHQHKKQRGRQKYKSCQSPERNINPRGQVFQNSDEDIDIRSSWFKHSKRGLG